MNVNRTGDFHQLRGRTRRRKAEYREAQRTLDSVVTHAEREKEKESRAFQRVSYFSHKFNELQTKKKKSLPFDSVLICPKITSKVAN